MYRQRSDLSLLRGRCVCVALRLRGSSLASPNLGVVEGSHAAVVFIVGALGSVFWRGGVVTFRLLRWVPVRVVVLGRYGRGE